VDFTDVVRGRHMVREFTDEPVAPESLDRILANAVRGPSAGFSQGQAFLVLTGEERDRFWAVAGAAAAPSVTAAPVVIVPMSSKRVYLDRYARPDKGWTDRDEARWPVPFWHIDTGMAALLILLTVVDDRHRPRRRGGTARSAVSPAPRRGRHALRPLVTARRAYGRG
jgi:nitroreductase